MPSSSSIESSSHAFGIGRVIGSGAQATIHEYLSGNSSTRGGKLVCKVMAVAEFRRTLTALSEIEKQEEEAKSEAPTPPSSASAPPTSEPVVSPAVLEENHTSVKEVQKLNHPNIITYEKIFYAPAESLVVVMPRYAATLGEWCYRHRNHITEVMVLHIAKQLASALAYLHEQKVWHLDVNCMNVLVSSLHDKTPHCVLIDLETSTIGGRAPSREAFTAEMAAPEREANPSAKCDVWSLGMMLFALAARHEFPGIVPDVPDLDHVSMNHKQLTPYRIAAVVRRDLMSNAGDGNAQSPTSLSGRCSEGLVSLITIMLNHDAHTRPSIQTVLVNINALKSGNGDASMLRFPHTLGPFSLAEVKDVAPPVPSSELQQPPTANQDTDDSPAKLHLYIKSCMFDLHGQCYKCKKRRSFDKVNRRSCKDGSLHMPGHTSTFWMAVPSATGSGYLLPDLIPPQRPAPTKREAPVTKVEPTAAGWSSSFVPPPVVFGGEAPAHQSDVKTPNDDGNADTTTAAQPETTSALPEPPIVFSATEEAIQDNLSSTADENETKPGDEAPENEQDHEASPFPDAVTSSFFPVPNARQQPAPISLMSFLYPMSCDPTASSSIKKPLHQLQIHGGFAVFDDPSAAIANTAGGGSADSSIVTPTSLFSIAQYSPRTYGSNALYFSAAQPWPSSCTSTLMKAGRIHQDVPSLLGETDISSKCFCWLMPLESFTLPNGEKWIAAPDGGFVFWFNSNPMEPHELDRYFAVSATLENRHYAHTEAAAGPSAAEKLAAKTGTAISTAFVKGAANISSAFKSLGKVIAASASPQMRAACSSTFSSNNGSFSFGMRIFGKCHSSKLIRIERTAHNSGGGHQDPTLISTLLMYRIPTTGEVGECDVAAFDLTPSRHKALNAPATAKCALFLRSVPKSGGAPRLLGQGGFAFFDAAVPTTDVANVALPNCVGFTSLRIFTEGGVEVPSLVNDDSTGFELLLDTTSSPTRLGEYPPESAAMKPMEIEQLATPQPSTGATDLVVDEEPPLQQREVSTGGDSAYGTLVGSSVVNRPRVASGALAGGGGGGSTTPLQPPPRDTTEDWDCILPGGIHWMGFSRKDFAFLFADGDKKEWQVRRIAE